jgi:hypothetical protein
MAQQRMSATLTRLARKRGRLPALVTAALIAALILVQGLLASVAAWIFGGLYERVSFGAAAFEFHAWQPGYVIEPFLTVTLPFAIGVFLSLWLIAPLAAELTVAFVVTRGLLASAVGALLVLVVNFVIDLVRLVGFGFDIRGFAHAVITEVGQAVDVFIYTTPIVLLGAVLLWLWLRAHPRDYEVAGLIDEL